MDVIDLFTNAKINRVKKNILPVYRDFDTVVKDLIPRNPDSIKTITEDKDDLLIDLYL